MRSNSQRGLGSSENVWRVHALIGNFLVVACALLLAVMPLTEHYWTFDGFLLGSPDFELSLLAFLTILCLILLLAYLGKRGVSVRLSLKRWLWFIFKGDAPGFDQCAFLRESDDEYNLGSGLGSYNQPLQI